MTQARVTVETHEQGFTLKTNVQLPQLHCLIDGETFTWVETKKDDQYAYDLDMDTLTYMMTKMPKARTFVLFYGADKRTLSFNDFEVTFDGKSTLYVDQQAVSVYPSMDDNLRLGFKWLANGNILIEDMFVEDLKVDQGQMLITANLISNFIPVKRIDVTGHFTESDTKVAVMTDIANQHRLDHNQYQQTITMGVAIADCQPLFERIWQSPFENLNFNLTYQMVNDWFATSVVNFNVKVTPDQLRQLNVIAVDHPLDWDIFVPTRLENANFALRGLVVDQQALDMLTQPQQVTATDVLFVDADVQEPAELWHAFTSLREQQRQNVYYVTMADVEEDDHVLRYGSGAHLAHILSAKAVVYAERLVAVDAFRIDLTQRKLSGVQKIFVPTDLQQNMRDTAFKAIPGADVKVVTGSDVETKYAKNVVGLKADKVLEVGKPMFDEIYERHQQRVSDAQKAKQVLWAITPELLVQVTQQIDLIAAMQHSNQTHYCDNQKQTMAPADPFVALTPHVQLALSDFALVVTDDEQTAKVASALHLPTVLIDENIQKHDAYYWLSGPAFKTLAIAKINLLQILNGRFDFDAYITQSYHNLNNFDDSKSAERLLDLI
ncbi:hypothetical protein D3P96_04320 [Weissella viridescens]|uniref:Uncharacterized protein n=1 Tax=Weissella viridescens TaxID=1629 RepID=A0A3P2RC27_WEIVI|nr:hypothetical protein [Weissella viridescens]RRG18153.1 hypothetical protein D3P96_04320 [Weissella viridescens]